MRNVMIARGFTLILLALMVTANEKLDLIKEKDANPKSKELNQYVESLIKSESEKSAMPELGILQKPVLLKKNEAKSETGESSIKHMKSLPESENVLEHESARHKVTSANDNTHNGAVSPALMPSLQNDSMLAHRDNTINSPTAHTSVPIKNLTNQRLPITYEQSKKLISNGSNENALPNSPAPPKSPENHLRLPETHNQMNSTPSSNENEEITIGPFDLEVVTDIIASMLFESTESDRTEASTESYEEAVVDVVVIEEPDTGEIDSITDRPESETSAHGLFTEASAEFPLSEAITLLENLESEATTLLANIGFLPIDKFDYFVFDENSTVPCILLAMNLTLSISYETKDQKHTTTDLQLPNAVLVTGHCGNANSSMTLSWTDDSPIINQNRITIDFAKDNSSFYVDSLHVNITLDSHNFPNAKDSYISGNSSANLKLFSAPVQNGIHVCPAETKVTCGNIVATINNVTVIAYNKNQELSNRKEEYCNIASETDQEVNIASIIGGIVGAVIALAIAVTLVSWYRRRSDIALRLV